MTLTSWATLLSALVIALAYLNVSRKLDRIRERARRVLEGEGWWLSSSDMHSESDDAAIRAAVESEEAAARWLLKVIDGQGYGGTRK